MATCNTNIRTIHCWTKYFSHVKTQTPQVLAAFVVNLIEAKLTEFKLTGICTNQTLMNRAQANMDKRHDTSMKVSDQKNESFLFGLLVAYWADSIHVCVPATACLELLHIFKTASTHKSQLGVYSRGPTGYRLHICKCLRNTAFLYSAQVLCFMVAPSVQCTTKKKKKKHNQKRKYLYLFDSTYCMQHDNTMQYMQICFLHVC